MSWIAFDGQIFFRINPRRSIQNPGHSRLLRFLLHFHGNFFRKNSKLSLKEAQIRIWFHKYAFILLFGVNDNNT